MQSQDKTDRILVGIRVRPLIQSELGKENVVYLGEDNQTIRITDNNHYIETKYDRIFNENCQQDEIFSFVQDQIQQVVKGYNCTILAYGQTGSGKTYTMFGANWELNRRQQQIHPKNHGVIPRAVQNLFEGIAQVQQLKGNFTVYCSFIQIYNEKLFDLLQDEERQKPLAIREDLVSGIFVEGLSEYVVQSPRDCLALIKRGDRNRAVRQTKFNNHSSRSHTIFQLLIESDKVNKKGNLKRAKINMCDLAGSEKYDKEGEMKEVHLAEMTKINLSLTNLGKVISSLSKGQKSTHIPFRDSKLTRLLQDSLGGNCKTILISMIAPVSHFVDESISTLKFADRAKQVMIRVKKNEISATNDALIKKLQKEIGHLRELLNVKRRGNQNDFSYKLLQLKEENDRLRDIAQVTPNDVENLKKENKQLRLELQRVFIQSPTSRSTISTQDPDIYTFIDSEQPPSQANSQAILQHNAKMFPMQVQQDQLNKMSQKQTSCQELTFNPASANHHNFSQRDLQQIDQNKVNSQEDMHQFLVFEGKCYRCQQKPPCAHYINSQQLINEQKNYHLQQKNVEKQSAQISQNILQQKIAQNNNLNQSSPDQPQFGSQMSVKSGFKVSSVSLRSDNLSTAGRMITRSQVLSSNNNDQVQIRIRTRNNMYQSATGNVQKSNKEVEQELNRVKQIRRAEERLKTLDQIEKFKQEKLERELQALEEQK